MPDASRIARRLARCCTYVPGAEVVLTRIGHRFHYCRPIAALCFHFGNALAERKKGAERVACVGKRGQLRVPLDENMFRQIYLFGTHERETSELLQAVVEPGDNWLDIGANIGLFTITLAELVGSNGRVTAYEPNPRLVAYLQGSIKDNKCSHVRLRPVAVGAQRGVAELHIPLDADKTPGGSGRASLLAEHAIGATTPTHVDVVAVDDEFSEDDRIDGIKIDVEGFEAAAFSGMQRMLRVRPPRLILFEAMQTKSALRTPNELIQNLEGFGYQCMHVPTRSRLLSSDGYAGGLCDNVLAIRSDAVDSVLKRWGNRR